MTEELIGPKELSAEWGVALGTLANWRYTGRGPRFVKISGKHVRYRRGDLEAWLERQAREPRTTA